MKQIVERIQKKLPNESNSIECIYTGNSISIVFIKVVNQQRFFDF